MLHSRLSSTRWTTVTCGIIMTLCFAAVVSFAQNKKTWQAGTILEVKTHDAAPENDQGAKQYDISVKVGKKIYVVLYTLREDQAEPEFYVGMARTVLVEGDTLKFNDLQGRTHSMPILSCKDAPAEKSN